MSNKLNLLGQKFGTMVVIREVPKEEKTNKAKHIYWELECEICGTKRYASTNQLRQRGIKCRCQKRSDALDLTGQTFGKLTVVKMATKLELQQLIDRLDDATRCWCQCSCGNPELILVRSKNLRNGRTQSCGCLTATDLKGQRFGKLTVKRIATLKEKVDNGKNSTNAYWWCDCDCGNKNVLVMSTNLQAGNVKSCGCLRSYGEELIEKVLVDNNINFQREYSFDDLLGDYKPLRFDFVIFNNDKLIGLIECDGGLHRIDTFQGKLEKQQYYDKLKDNYCHEHNIPLLRIKYNRKEDIKENEILDFIRSNI